MTCLPPACTTTGRFIFFLDPVLIFTRSSHLRPPESLFTSGLLSVSFQGESMLFFFFWTCLPPLLFGPLFLERVALPYLTEEIRLVHLPGSSLHSFLCVTFFFGSHFSPGSLSVCLRPEYFPPPIPEDALYSKLAPSLFPLGLCPVYFCPGLVLDNRLPRRVCRLCPS